MKKVWALCLSACMAATPLLASAETAYTDGTYTVVKPGFGGDVTATVSVSDGKIDAVSLVGDKETRGIGSKAIELLPEQIVAAQSAEIEIRQRHFAALRVLYGPGAGFAGQKRIGPDRLACRKAVQHADGAPRRHGFVKGGGLQLFDAEHGDGQRCAILLRQQRERPVLVLQQHNPGSGSSARSQRVVAHSAVSYTHLTLPTTPSV